MKNLFSLFLFLVLSSGVNAQCLNQTHPDYDALMALYNSTDGANWTDKTGWVDGAAGSDCDPCNSWFGVNCNNGRVSELFLGSNNLIGSLPIEIGDLTSLSNLRLNQNQLSGSIPAEIGDLSNLRFLWLFLNQLSGPIPGEIGKLDNLIFLFAYGNQLSGSLPVEIGDMTNLQSISMGQNLFSGSLPAEFGNLTNLNNLLIQDCQLSGSLPPELGDLANLEVLQLHGNDISGTLPSELGNLTKLTSLHLGSNNLSGCFPPSYYQFCNISFKKFTNNSGLPNGGDFQGTICMDGSGVCCEDDIVVSGDPIPGASTSTLYKAHNSIMASGSTSGAITFEAESSVELNPTFCAGADVELTVNIITCMQN